MTYRRLNRLSPTGHATTAILIVASVLAGGLAGAAVPRISPPQEREIEIIARKYAYDPPVIRANQGDTLHFRFKSADVTHGFFLEGYDVNVRIIPNAPEVELSRPSTPDSPPEKVESVTVVAKETGKYRFRCSRTCGFLHPFMLGELIVEPNRFYPASLGMAVGLLLGGGLVVARKTKVRFLSDEGRAS